MDLQPPGLFYLTITYKLSFLCLSGTSDIAQLEAAAANPGAPVVVSACWGSFTNTTKIAVFKLSIIGPR